MAYYKKRKSKTKIKREVKAKQKQIAQISEKGDITFFIVTTKRAIKKARKKKLTFEESVYNWNICRAKYMGRIEGKE